MTDYVVRSQLQVSAELAEFVESEVLPGLDYSASNIWESLHKLLQTFTPKNQALLDVRADLQTKIQSHLKNSTSSDPAKSDKAFLKEIGYLVDAPEDFTIETSKTDPEVSSIAGPQLVVPVSNARYVLNAANARWGSLYDALYGTDAIDAPAASSPAYDPVRGEQVIAWSKNFLDGVCPIDEGRYADATGFRVVHEELEVCIDGTWRGLVTPSRFVGFTGDAENPSGVLLRHHDLHIFIRIDADDPIGATDPAMISDIDLEAAISTIVDFEDSVAAVDGEDKTHCYRNWLGLMKGDLKETFDKHGKSQTRQLNTDRSFVSPSGTRFNLKGRSLLLVRNVGHLMTTPAVLLSDGSEAFEGLLDAFLTSLIALHDIRGDELNSRHRSIYIVKPKMHGPEEAAFANDVFDAVEDALDLSRATIKIGLMDEERRTSVNLKACIAALKSRIIFINTGFLDRTGDEIHTAMSAGIVVDKPSMKSQEWLAAYEARNVAIGLQAGFSGRAQIGKGMWAKPDYMGDMLKEKVGHPLSGATCAWVPSPTAATLHATHYHEVDVKRVHRETKVDASELEDSLLTIPLAKVDQLSTDMIKLHVRDSCQSILGYVVRWVDQGVGCSKVPDIHDIGLMEDRATLRISCQMLANWIRHGLCTQEVVLEALAEMARVVDRQNASDPLYTPMHPDLESNTAFQAAKELILNGANDPSGYTEPTLHAKRREMKDKIRTLKMETAHADS